MARDIMIIAGIGLRASATQKAMSSALDIACQTAGVTQVDLLATEITKSQSPVLRKFAADKSLPLQGVTVYGVVTPTQSARIQTLFGTGSLAEAAALVAAGPNAKLICPRVTSICGRVTIALAQEIT